MTSKPGLAPCPFCKNQDKVDTWFTHNKYGPNGWRAGCLNPDCDINPFTRTRWNTEEEAIVSWNRRK
jgi:hypothetical protein